MLLSFRSGAGPIARGQPVRALCLERPGRALQRQYLRHCPDARWVPLAGHRIRIGPLGWSSQRPWQPPAGQHLPDNNINTLLAARDGTLWIGTFNGLATLSGGKLTRRPELDGRIVESLLEDREGTVWAGALFSSTAG